MIKPEKLKSGRYRARYRDADGKVQSVPGTFARLADAEEVAIEAQAKANRQSAGRTGRLSAKTPYRDWCEVFNQDRDLRSDASYTEASMMKNHILPRWGDVDLIDIKRYDAKKWAAKLQREFAQWTARRIFGLFRTTINAAVDAEILGASPLAGIKVAMPSGKPKRYLTPAQAVPYFELMPSWAHRAAKFEAYTGTRPGEMAAVHADNINFEEKYVDITHVYVMRHGFIRLCASNKPGRRIPLPDEALTQASEALKDRDLSKSCGIKHVDGKPCRSPIVFVNDNGEVVTRKRVTYELKKAAKKGGMPEKSAYDLRRGYATWLAMNGVPPTDIKRAMGHATLEQTDEYVQETPAAASGIRTALGDRPPLTVVPDPEDVGRAPSRGTSRGTQATEHPGASGGIGRNGHTG